MSTPPDLPPPPNQTKGELAGQFAAALIGDVAGTVPVLPGNTIAEALALVFGMPFQRRQDAWQQSVYEVLQYLLARGFDLDALASNERWITAVHDASRVALGEHIVEKIEMLKAVLINAAATTDPSADLWTLRYLRWIDQLEVQHIAVLQFSADPRAWLEARGKAVPEFAISSSISQTLNLAQFPYPDGDMQLILADLADLKLAQGAGSTMMSASAAYSPWITDIGKRFLRWITLM